MKKELNIISLNVNAFDGSKGYHEMLVMPIASMIHTWREANRELRFNNLTQILESVTGADIVVLHEVPTQCYTYEKLLDKMDQDYNVIYPNGFKTDFLVKTNRYISLAFVKKDLENIEVSEESFNGYLRNVEFKVDGLNVLGVHAPSHEKALMQYWNPLIKRVAQLREANQPVMVIGDLGSFKEESAGETKMAELLELINDTWLSKGFDKDQVTFKSFRCDYVLLSEEFDVENYDVKIMDDLREKNFTDHSSIQIKI